MDDRKLEYRESVAFGQPIVLQGMPFTEDSPAT